MARMPNWRKKGLDTWYHSITHETIIVSTVKNTDGKFNIVWEHPESKRIETIGEEPTRKEARVFASHFIKKNLVERTANASYLPISIGTHHRPKHQKKIKRAKTLEAKIDETPMNNYKKIPFEIETPKSVLSEDTKIPKQVDIIEEYITERKHVFVNSLSQISETIAKLDDPAQIKDMLFMLKMEIANFEAIQYRKQVSKECLKCQEGRGEKKESS